MCLAFLIHAKGFTLYTIIQGNVQGKIGNNIGELNNSR